MKGFKAFDKDLKCRTMQFTVGETYEIKGDLKICENGFHFCQNFHDVYSYYPKHTSTRICEVEALGETVTDGDKTVTSKIKIIKEYTKEELLDFWINKSNSGDGNSGNRNSGNRNSGDGNSGYGNSGDWNSGNRNSGYWNSGDGNSGNRNSGNRNSGNRNSGYGNSGYGNSGNRNSGDWNSGDGNSGYFNTEVPVYFFNKPSKTQYSQDLENRLRSINVKPIVTYVPESLMTEQEKLDNPSHKVTGGFLRKTCKMDWTQLTEEDKKLILSLPNYDDEIFKIISNGVSLLEPKTIKIIHNGQEFEIDIKKAKELGLVK